MKSMFLCLVVLTSFPLGGCAGGLSVDCERLGDSYIQAMQRYGQLNRQFDADRDNDRFENWQDNREAFGKVEEARNAMTSLSSRLESTCGTAGLKYVNDKLYGE